MNIPRVDILSGGKRLNPQYELVAIDILHSVNKVPAARISLLIDTFELDKNLRDLGDFFVPQRPVDILLGYEGSRTRPQKVFSGLLVRRHIAYATEDVVLEIELRDVAQRLVGPRREAVYQEQTDDQIIRQLIEGAGLESGSLTATGETHEELVRSLSTDWDFLLQRAEANSRLVLVDDGKVSLHKASTDGAIKHRYEFGVSIIYGCRLEEEIDFQQNNHRQEARKKAVPKSTSKSILKKAALSKEHQPAMSERALSDKRTISHTRGTLQLPGFTDLQLLDIVELSRFGPHWQGKTVISGVYHRLDQNGWMTQLQLGLPEGMLSMDDVGKS